MRYATIISLSNNKHPEQITLTAVRKPHHAYIENEKNALISPKINLKKMADFPEELKYTKDHEWVRIEGDVATVGITDFAQGELGDIVYIEIETIGDSLQHGDVFGTVEAVKTVSDLYMPVSGEVLELNDKLEGEPELVNRDPYGDGWMVKIRLSDAAEAEGLMSAADYRELIGQ